MMFFGLAIIIIIIGISLILIGNRTGDNGKNLYIGMLCISAGAVILAVMRMVNGKFF